MKDYDKNKTQDVINAEVDAALSDKYQKPVGGITKNDLAEGVQTSLNKADSALQSQEQADWNESDSTKADFIKNKPSIPDVSGKADKDEMTVTPGTGADADKTTIQLKQETSATVLVAHQDISGKADKATTLEGYGITDGYTKTEGQELESEVDDRLDVQDAAIALLNGSDVVVVADHTDATEVPNPDPQKIYREYGTDSYTDYMCVDATTTPVTWQALATYSYPGVDDVPTADSEKLVKSGGVARVIGESFVLTNYPARIDLSQSTAGSFKGYQYNLVGLYDKGIRHILFRGSSPSDFTTANITAGLIIADDDTVEITARDIETVSHSDWLVLPITEHSKTFWGTYCFNNTYVSNPVFSPSKIWFFSEEYGEIYDLIYDIERRISSPKVTQTNYPARVPASETESGYFAGYRFDLTGLYDKGYRAIVFRGATFDQVGNIYAGVIYDAEMNVLQSVRSSVQETNDYYILPLTSASKYFWGTVCKNATGGEVFTVSCVHLVDVKTYNAIVNALYKTDIVNDLTTGGATKVLSAEQGKVLAEQEKVLNEYIFGSSFELQTTLGGSYPARNDGSYSTSGYYRRYIVDVSSLYLQGYTKIRFFGFSYTSDNTITPGLITSSTNIDTNYTVESYVQVTQNYICGYYELPITENSKYLIATVLTGLGVTTVGNNFTMPEGMTADYVPSTVIAISESQKGIVERIETLEDEIKKIPKEFPDTFLPKKIYGVVGDTLQIFKRGVVISQTPYALSCEFLCNQGKEYERYLEITPALSGGSVPSGLTIKHRLIDNHYNESPQTTSDFVVANTPSSPSNNINVLCIGASTTENGEWASELKRRLTDSGGTPVANGLSNITFVGRKNKTASGTTRPMDVKVEATGGWQWKTFYTPQQAVRFIVSGVNSVNIGDVYQYLNASNQTVKVSVAEVNVTAGNGNIRFLYNYDTVGKGVPANASGTITKVSGSGDATITYSSASEETYCPFYDANNPGTKADFTNYANEYCGGQIDVAIFYLGNINAGLVGDANMSTIISDMKVMLDGLHEDFPNCKVIIAPGIGYSTLDGVEYNYGADSNFRTWGLLFAQFKYAKAIEDFISDNSYKNWCYLANTIAEVDSENIFPTTTKEVNTRMSKTEIIGTNGAHPDLPGYKMVADSIYRCFVNTILT